MNRWSRCQIFTSPDSEEVVSAGALTRPAGAGGAAGGPRMSKGRERVRVGQRGPSPSHRSCNGSPRKRRTREFLFYLSRFGRGRERRSRERVRENAGRGVL